MKKYILAVLFFGAIALSPFLAGAQSTTSGSFGGTTRVACAPGDLYDYTTGKPCSSSTSSTSNITPISTGAGLLLPTTLPTIAQAPTFSSISLPAKPTKGVTLTASATSVVLGQSATLAWNSGSASYCSSPDFYVPRTNSLSGSTIVYPLKTTTYWITCYTSTGTQQASVTITVGGTGSASPTGPITPPPAASNTVDIKVNGSDGPMTLAAGQSVVLSWTSSNTTGCNLSSPQIPAVSSGVSSTSPATVYTIGHPFFPTASTTYTIRCNLINANGSTSSTTVTDSVVVTPMTTSTTTPTTPITFTLDSFKAGDRVKPNTQSASARSTPNGTAVHILSLGELGTITSAPAVQSGGHVWWQVTWDTGVTAWTVEEYLDPASGYPWHVPTWDELAQMYAYKIPGYTGAQIQTIYPGFPVENAELTLALNGVPGGVFFPSDSLAVTMYQIGTVGPQAAQNPNSNINQLEIMLQNGIPRAYVSALWERAKRISGQTQWPSYATARALTLNTTTWPQEYVPATTAQGYTDPLNPPSIGDWEWVTSATAQQLGVTSLSIYGRYTYENSQSGNNKLILYNLDGTISKALSAKDGGTQFSGSPRPTPGYWKQPLSFPPGCFSNSGLSAFGGGSCSSSTNATPPTAQQTAYNSAVVSCAARGHSKVLWMGTTYYACETPTGYMDPSNGTVFSPLGGYFDRNGQRLSDPSTTTSTKFSAGDRVTATGTGVRGRHAPYGFILRNLTNGEMGTVVVKGYLEPLDAIDTINTGGFSWWKVQWDGGDTLWVAENYLQ